MEAKTANEIHKQGIDALVKVLGQSRCGTVPPDI